MTPGGFISKWRSVALKERSAAQSHFNDLCRLLDVEDPVSADPKGEWFTFEKGATKSGGGNGWADVWRKGCFGWEYKGKHRLFVWLSGRNCPDHQLIVIARDDDTTFGILHSRFHELWSLRMGTSLEDRPRYTPSTTFETFPFPEGLTPDIPARAYAADPRAQAVAAAAARLNDLREAWLNPPDLVRRVPEVVPGFPDRLLPVDEAAAKVLKTRTLTNLYNARPGWLDHAHRALDEAVAEAYGWGGDWRAGALSDEEILARLFRLNGERAARPSLV